MNFLTFLHKPTPLNLTLRLFSFMPANQRRIAYYFLTFLFCLSYLKVQAEDQYTTSVVFPANKILLQKIEELMLHLIDLKKENESIKQEIKTIKNK